MQDLLGNNILNEKCVLISSDNLSQKFSHYKKYSARWYHKRKATWRRATSALIRLQWNINLQVRHSKNPQMFRNKLFIAERQRERERGMGMMSLTVAFRNFGTPLQTWHRYTDGLRNFCNLYRRHIWCHLTICRIKTAIHTIHWLTDVLNSESPVLINDAEAQSFRISLRKWMVAFLNKSLPLPSDIPTYYKLQNTKCSDELQCAQKISSFNINVWTLRNSKIIQNSTQYGRLLQKIKDCIHVHATAGLSSTSMWKGEKEIAKLFLQPTTTTEWSLRTPLINISSKFLLYFRLLQR